LAFHGQALFGVLLHCLAHSSFGRKLLFLLQKPLLKLVRLDTRSMQR
jgi:hypothetical protein